MQIKFFKLEEKTKTFKIRKKLFFKLNNFLGIRIEDDISFGTISEVQNR